MRNRVKNIRALERWGLAASLIAVAIAVVVVPVLFGAPLAITLTAAAVVLGVGNTVLAPRLNEAGRRSPQLSLSIDESSDDGSQVQASHLPPWPIDADRIVRNTMTETKAASRAAYDLGSRDLPSAVSLIVSAADVRPSPAARKRAFATYVNETLPEYERRLREWLESYEEAASARSRTFTLTVRISNHRKGAHADDVQVDFRIPPTIEVVEGPTRPHSEPPVAPQYVEPRTTPDFRGAFDIAPTFSPSGLNAAIRKLSQEFASPTQAWTELEDDTLRTALRRVHAGENLAVPQTLMLRATEPGTHTIAYTIRSTNTRSIVEGTVDLVLPTPPQRPRFGRIEGVTTYPDVPLESDNTLAGSSHHASAVIPARTTDPPLARPLTQAPGGGQTQHAQRVLDKIRAHGAAQRWRALGLDPADDASSPDQASEAKPADEVLP